MQQLHSMHLQAPLVAAPHPESLLDLFIDNLMRSSLQSFLPTVFFVRHLPYLGLHVQLHGLPVFSMGVGPPNAAQLLKVAVRYLIALLGSGLRKLRMCVIFQLIRA